MTVVYEDHSDDAAGTEVPMRRIKFTVNGQEICARVDPAAARGPGEQMRLSANVEHMHLIDPPTDTVL